LLRDAGRTARPPAPWSLSAMCRTRLQSDSGNLHITQTTFGSNLPLDPASFAKSPSLVEVSSLDPSGSACFIQPAGCRVRWIRRPLECRTAFAGSKAPRSPHEHLSHTTPARNRRHVKVADIERQAQFGCREVTFMTSEPTTSWLASATGTRGSKVPVGISQARTAVFVTAASDIGCL